MVINVLSAAFIFVLVVLYSCKWIRAYRIKRALSYLISLYEKHDKDRLVGDAQKLTHNYKCPLCKIYASDCHDCIWTERTGNSCIRNRYSTMTCDERVKQIKEWMK